MTRSMKAALLSVLIFPGIGQLFLRKYASAMVIGGAAFAGFYFLVEETTAQALRITGEIQSGAVPADIGSISQMVSDGASGSAARNANIAFIVLSISWLFGIVHAYWAGGEQRERDTDE